jgi:TM2 domain-containing membrane protein YozV
MNCATHPDVAAVAYCRTCGKPLCATCSRDVQGVIYCESCLAERLHGTLPPPRVVPPPVPGAVPVVVTNEGPNPALAGILAGFFPFGVGAVYTGQYAKGLAHLLIFTGIIWGLSSGPGSLGAVLGLGMAFFYVYQIVDSIRSAHAVRLGQPAPDPFGLGQTFTTGDKTDVSKIPMAAVILIGLGVLFLLNTTIDLGINRLWPLFLIGLGVWLFAKRFGLAGGYVRPGLGYRQLMGPAVLVTIGSLFLLDNLDGPSWGRTWPILLLVIGLIKLLESQGRPPAAGGPGPSAPPPAGEAQPPSGEVTHV